MADLHAEFDAEPDLHAAFDAEPDAEAVAPHQAPVTLGAGPTAALHASRHLAFSLGDKITAAIQALSDLHHDKTGKHNFSESYRRNLDFNDQLLEDSDKAHPAARWTGNALGIGGNLAGLAAAGPVRAALGLGASTATAPAASILGRALQGAGEGAKIGSAAGAAGGFGASRGSHPVVDTARGAVGGLITGGVLGGIGGPISGKLAQRAQPQPPSTAPAAGELPLIARGTSPTPEAQTLQKYGIPLTLGQMQPTGAASEIEEAAGRVPFLGTSINAQRKAAEDAWRSTVLNEARPPIPGALGPGGAIEKLQRIKQDFGQAYGSIAEKPVPIGAIHPETGELVNPTLAFDAILKDPDYQAGDSEIGVVSRVLKDQLGKLYRSTEEGGPVQAKLLMNMRSNLRDAAQEARLSGSHSTSRMFQDAADSVGGGLKAGLTGEDLTALNKTDAAYSRFMKVVDAAKRAGRNAEEGEFGPKHLSAALEKSYGKAFATDPSAGGALRELATAGKYAFTPRVPLTGHGEMLKSALGYSLGPLVYRANESPAAQAAFMQAAQRAASSGAQRLQPPAAGEIEGALTGALGRLTPGTVPSELSNQLAQAAALRKGTQ